MDLKAQCYTIGYGNRSFDELVHMLEDNSISHLVDIRRYPQSVFEHFNMEALERMLPMHDIIYKHCEGVGGMRESSYSEYMGTEEFRNSFESLLRYIRKVHGNGGKLVLMCAEKSPKGCHRHYLSMKLEENDVEVTHLVEPGQVSLLSF